MTNKSNLLSLEGIEQQEIKVFSEQAYLDYSMYVILDRALPNIADGLKPVQRRIIYAMSELGLNAAAKFKKSARTVGDVLGKFHPHGDTACYEAMVLMAQPFSYRYPFVDGQGNWGSVDDPKSFAAMRYTEAKLSKYAEVLLGELAQGTVEWLPNFDGTLDEPKLLPARLPNILLNGASGIAVGMATDIPPHNLKEVADACIYLLENPKATVKELCKIIKAPDYPSMAEIITPKSDILKMYETGIGSLRMRATFIEEDGEIIINALPHLVSGSKVLEQIAQLMQAKKLPLVSDLRDESSHENPIRLVIVPRSNRVDVSIIMNHLFATTDLERSYRVNMNVVGLDGKPKVKNLIELLSEWLAYRHQTIKARLSHRLEKVLNRLHLLDGFLIAYLNLDKVIKIIREEDNPKTSLMEEFALSEIQAEAILEIKLRQLAKLEEVRIRAEQKELSQEKDQLEKMLSSDQKLRALMKNELIADANNFGDKRCSKLVERAQAQISTEIEKIPSELMTVVLSNKGWIRAGKGHEVDPLSLSYKAGDEFKFALKTKSDEPMVVIDSFGKAYSILPHTLPSARGQGEPLTSRINPEAGASFSGLITGNPSDKFLLLSSNGFGFIIDFESMLGKNRNGKTTIKVSENSQLLEPLKVNHFNEDLLVVLTSDCWLLIFPVNEIAQMTKGKGNKIITLSKNHKIASALIIYKKQMINVVSGKRKIKLTMAELKHYKDEMASRGHKLPKEITKAEKLEIVE